MGEDAFGQDVHGEGVNVMAGKLHSGLAATDPGQRIPTDYKVAKAWADGRQHAKGGGLIGDNPFDTKVEIEKNEAWTAGFTDFGAAPTERNHSAVYA